MIFSVIVLGVILGSFFCFDLFFNRKKNGSFIRSIVYIFTISIPAIYQATIAQQYLGTSDFASVWFSWFYPSFGITVLIFMFVMYCSARLLMKELKKDNNQRVITYLDLIYNGYPEFKKQIELYTEEAKKTRKKESLQNFNLMRNMQSDVKDFVHKMFITLDSETNSDGYALYFLTEFINNFFGKSNARFTFRKIDSTGKKMIALLSTSDKIPKDIPLNKMNLIERSRDLKTPVIYSRDNSYHYKTSQNSHGKKLYNDYVSYCLLETEDNKPLISLSLDVKEGLPTKRMHALVDSTIYQVICEALAIKIIKENE